MTWSLAETHIPFNIGVVHFIAKIFMEFLHYLPGEVEPVIIHGYKNTLNLQFLIQMFLHHADCIQQLGESLQGIIFTLYGNDNGVSRG